MGTPIALLIVGVLMVFMPGIISPAGKTLFGTTTLGWDLWTQVKDRFLVDCLAQINVLEARKWSMSTYNFDIGAWRLYSLRRLDPAFIKFQKKYLSVIIMRVFFVVLQQK